MSDAALDFEPTSKALEALRNWRFAAFGRRPADYAERDLVLGGLSRDSRMPLFNRIAKERPAWLVDDLELPDGPNPTTSLVVKIRALHALHLEHLAKLRSSFRVRQEDEDGRELRKLLFRMSKCVPSMALFRHRSVGKVRPCNYPRECPFCYSRLVRRLLRQVEEDYLPALAANAGCLLTLSAEISDQTLPGVAKFSGELVAKMNLVKQRLKGSLRTLAEELGAIGGLTVFEVGPQRVTVQTWEAQALQLQAVNGFTYSNSLLAAVPQPSTLMQTALRERDHRPIMERFKGLSRLEGVRLSCFMHSPTQTGLRLALVGRAPSFSRGTDAGGFRGAFAYQPWFISSDEQWFQYAESTKGLRLFDRWGAWKANVAPPGVAPPFVNAPQRRGRFNTRKALEAVNTAKRQSRDIRREELLEWIAHQSASDELRYLSRRRLQSWTESRGRSISQRDATWLALHLKSTVAQMPFSDGALPAQQHFLYDEPEIPHQQVEVCRLR